MGFVIVKKNEFLIVFILKKSLIILFFINWFKMNVFVFCVLYYFFVKRINICKKNLFNMCYVFIYWIEMLKYKKF